MGLLPRSPAHALKLIAAGHTVWGVVAYRDALRELARDGLVDSVGDGIFRKGHSHDGRSSAFWFLAAGPLVALSGDLAESAIRSRDRRAVMRAGAAVMAISAVGEAMMPRSGFPGGVAIGAWLAVYGRRL